MRGPPDAAPWSVPRRRTNGADALSLPPGVATSEPSGWAAVNHKLAHCLSGQTYGQNPKIGGQGTAPCQAPPSAALSDRPFASAAFFGRKRARASHRDEDRIERRYGRPIRRAGDWSCIIQAWSLYFRVLVERRHSGGNPLGRVSSVLQPAVADRRGEGAAGGSRKGIVLWRAAPDPPALAPRALAGLSPPKRRARRRKARASGNIRPRGAATALAPPGAALYYASLGKARTQRSVARTRSVFISPRRQSMRCVPWV